MSAAFPIVTAYGMHMENDPGLSAREYFAAHAPAVPDWFKHQSSTSVPKVPDPEQELHPLDKSHLKQWIEGHMAIEHLSPELRAFLVRYQPAKAVFDEWRRQSRCEKFFKWRYFYADMMIAEGAK